MADQKPIFEAIFSDQWQALPPVMKKHYANKPFSNDAVVLEGKMDLMCKWYIKPVFKLMGIFPAENISGIHAKVVLKSDPNNSDFLFLRRFYLTDDRPFHFNSRMIPQGGNEMKEVMRFGLAWHSLFSWEEGQVKLTHKAYSLNLGSVSIKLPFEWLIGKSDAYEVVEDTDHFSMAAMITHPLLGKIYEYKGRFKIIEMKL